MATDRIITPTIRAVALVGLVALAGIVAARIVRLSESGDDARVAAALVRDSLAASADTTRRLHLRVGALGESLTVVQRRAVQTLQESDALDRALGMERVARVRLTARVAAMTRTVRAETVTERFADSAADGDQQVTTADDRTATFDVREPPYTVHAEV